MRPQLGLGEIGDAVAEAVDVNNSAFDHAARLDRSRARNFKSDVIFDLGADLFERRPAGDVGGDGCEYVAPVKGRADRMAEVSVVCDVENAQLRFAGVNETEDAVIRSDEKISSGLGDDRASRRPHAR